MTEQEVDSLVSHCSVIWSFPQHWLGYSVDLAENIGDFTLDVISVWVLFFCLSVKHKQSQHIKEKGTLYKIILFIHSILLFSKFRCSWNSQGPSKIHNMR